MNTFDLIAHLHRQREFSLRTFGPGPRTKGVLDHIRKELAEIEADPTDAEEWADLLLLALDGAWRAGHEPEAIAAALEAKQTTNEGRTWPDWRTAEPDKAIEHVRSEYAEAPATHYVVRNDGDAVFVKEAKFFEEQGGLTSEWGSRWVPVWACSIEEARQIGEEMLPKRSRY